MAVTRRTIWLTDERWTAIKEHAARRQQSPSTLIWELFTSGPAIAPQTRDPFREIHPVPKPGSKR